MSKFLSGVRSECCPRVRSLEGFYITVIRYGQVVAPIGLNYRRPKHDLLFLKLQHMKNYSNIILQAILLYMFSY